MDCTTPVVACNLIRYDPPGTSLRSANTRFLDTDDDASTPLSPNSSCLSSGSTLQSDSNLEPDHCRVEFCVPLLWNSTCAVGETFCALPVKMIATGGGAPAMQLSLTEHDTHWSHQLRMGPPLYPESVLQAQALIDIDASSETAFAGHAVHSYKPVDRL